jgi:cyclic pyranopterin phosphate synthase
MPEDEYVWLPRTSLLSFEEMHRLAMIFGGLGVDKLRITGGEPLLRRDLPDLVSRLAAKAQFKDIALTTNGLLLKKHAVALKQAGLHRVTLSLDTLRPDRFKTYSRGSHLEDAFAGIDELTAAGFEGTKINGVMTRGANDDEILDLFNFANARNAEMRYIEYMDVGGATDWSMSKVVTREDILAVFTEAFGEIKEESGTVDPSAPARRFVTPDGGRFGIVASTTHPFCRDCDRARLTADGHFFMCLYSDDSLDLRTPLREGVDDNGIAEIIRSAWGNRVDRGAETRAAMPDRSALYQLSGLKKKPHREMHTRGG